MENTTKLTVNAVETIFVECLTNENNPNMIGCTPVVHKCIFDKAKIENKSDEILGLLMELPAEFRRSSGGGYSFLMACNDINGNQWTGLHVNMEKLFALGMAAGHVEHLMPQEMWAILPGGVPYFVINDN